jgi:GNAT superfamily N-acetyltransferase
MFLLPESRGKGIGQKLMEKAKDSGMKKFI